MGMEDLYRRELRCLLAVTVGKYLGKFEIIDLITLLVVSKTKQ